MHKWGFNLTEGHSHHLYRAHMHVVSQAGIFLLAFSVSDVHASPRGPVPDFNRLPSSVTGLDFISRTVYLPNATLLDRSGLTAGILITPPPPGRLELPCAHLQRQRSAC